MDIIATAVQFAPVSLEVDYNLERMSGFIDQASKAGANLVVFPELADTGYVKWPQERAELRYMEEFLNITNPIPGRSFQVLAEAAKRNNVYVISGLAERDSIVTGRMFNSSVLISPEGKLIGTQRKITMTMTEPLFFTRGNKLEVFDTDFGKVGINICYDNFTPEHARIMTLKGMTLLCSLWAAAHPNPPTITPNSNIPTGFTPNMIKCTPMIRALENVVFNVSSSRVGADSSSGGNFFGNSVIVAPWGETIAEAGLDEEKFITAKLEFSILNSIRCTRPMLRDRRAELYHKISEIS